MRSKTLLSNKKCITSAKSASGKCTLGGGLPKDRLFLERMKSVPNLAGTGIKINPDLINSLSRLDLNKTGKPKSRIKFVNI